jgi:O-antigen/teichoic acid export membrane protein
MPNFLALIFKNFSPRQTFIKNSFWLTSGKLLASVLRALIVIAAARLLGVSNYGSFALAMNFILIFSFLPEFGLTAILTRELAKRQTPVLYRDRYDIFSHIATFTLILSALTYGAILLTAKFFIKDSLALTLVPILGLMMTADVLREFIYSIFRAKEKMELQAGFHLITNFLILALGLITLLKFKSPILLAYAYLTAISIGFFISLPLVSDFLYRFRPKIDIKVMKQIFASALPIALANFLLLLLTFIDSVILGWYHPARLVGLYSAAVKFNEFLIIFPQSIALAVFPLMAKSINEPDKLRQAVEMGLHLSLLLMLPLTLSIFILSDQLILFVFGADYIASIPGLRLIIFSLLGTFPFLVLSNLLIAIDKRKELLLFDVILVIINVVFNILLIPRFDLLAASYNTTLVSLLGFLFAYFISQKYVNFSFWQFVTKPLVASLIVALLLTLIKSLSLLLLIPIALVVYLFTLYLLKEELLLKITKRLKHPMSI